MVKLIDFEDTAPPVIYHSCYGNNLASMEKMCAKMPQPAPRVLAKFKKYFERVFEKEIQPLID
jgi:hypothetical protein